MNCCDLRQLARSEQLVQRLRDPDVSAHLEACAGCRALFGERAELGLTLGAMAREPTTEAGESQLPAELSAAMAAEDAQLSGKLRALSTPTRWALLLALGLSMPALKWLLAPRVDFEAYPLPRMLAVLLGLAVFGGLAAWSAVRSMARPVEDRRSWWMAAAALLVPCIVALLPETAHVHPANAPADSLVLGALPCLAMGLLFALPILVLWRVLDRAGGWDASTLLPAAAAGGAFGNLVLQLHCPVTRQLHLLLGHASVGALLALIAWQLSRRRVTR